MRRIPPGPILASLADLDLTNNKDMLFTGRERSRFVCDFVASDNLRGVFGLEIDQSYLANWLGRTRVPYMTRAYDAF